MNFLRGVAHALLRIFTETFRATRYGEFWAVVLLALTAAWMTAIIVVADNSPALLAPAFIGTVCAWAAVSYWQDLKRRMSQQ